MSAFHRQAIALNNIGVDLLEKTAYEQALTTLMDATNTMKVALRNSHHMEAGSTPSNQVRRAILRRSRPAPMERQPSYRMLNLTDNYDLILHDQDGSRFNSIYPIRIDDVHHDVRCPANLHDPDVQSAILIHNLALAHLCVARVSHHDHIKEAKLDHAIYLFELSNAIIERHGADLDDELTLRQLACLNMAVLSGLLVSCKRATFTERMRSDLRCRVSLLRSAVEVLDESLDEYMSYIHSAAAA